jgi:hypothetical protein
MNSKRLSKKERVLQTRSLEEEQRSIKHHGGVVFENWPFPVSKNAPLKYKLDLSRPVNAKSVEEKIKEKTGLDFGTGNPKKTKRVLTNEK